MVLIGRKDARVNRAPLSFLSKPSVQRTVEHCVEPENKKIFTRASTACSTIFSQVLCSLA